MISQQRDSVLTTIVTGDSIYSHLAQGNPVLGCVTKSQRREHAIVLLTKAADGPCFRAHITPPPAFPLLAHGLGKGVGISLPSLQSGRQLLSDKAGRESEFAHTTSGRKME